jgi:hypothetical protein
MQAVLAGRDGVPVGNTARHLVSPHTQGSGAMKEPKDKQTRPVRVERAVGPSVTKNVTSSPALSPSALRKSRRHPKIADHLSSLRSYENWARDVRELWKEKL